MQAARILVATLLVIVGGLADGQIACAAEPRPLREPATSAPTPVPHADRLEHLHKAAAHLEAAGLGEQAAHFREQAAQERTALRARLDRKLAELDKLQRETDELRRQVGAPQQIRLKLQILEADLSHEKLAELRQRLPGAAADAAAVDGISGILLAAAEAPATAPGRLAPYDRPSSRQLAETIAMLRSEGVVKVIAEPELVTSEGRPAHVQSGGEFPVPVPQPDGSHKMEWREFGIRMEAVPQPMTDGRVGLEVVASVAERDYAHCTRVDGLDVPGLTVTCVNTQLELRLGQPAVLGGMIVRSEGEHAEPRAVETLMILTAEAADPAF